MSQVSHSVDGIIIASEDLKLDKISEMEEKIETTLNVKEDTGQGTMDAANRTRLGQICNTLYVT